MVEKSGNFFFRDNSPQNPQGKGYKLCPGAYEESKTVQNRDDTFLLTVNRYKII